jgi:transcriptional regulator with XRE-family HTH domain
VRVVNEVSSLHERLKTLRTGKGLSQYEMARQFKMPRSTYANYETGEREPDFGTATRFAEFFGVTLDYLFGLTDDMQGHMPLPFSGGATTIIPPDDELIVVFRGKRQRLSPEYQRLLIKMMEAEADKQAEASMPAESKAGTKPVTMGRHGTGYKPKDDDQVKAAESEKPYGEPTVVATAPNQADKSK